MAALASLLAADGADARNLPEDLEERAALWRDRMAHKRMLLILDNAASSSQVTPLLPGSAGCLVLITSRRYLGDLPSAVSMLLEILPPEEAQRMFLRLAPRAATELARVAELVELCGYLPLAISLLASLFNKRRSWTLGHLITETRTTLLTVAAENRTVAAAFDLSCRTSDIRLAQSTVLIQSCSRCFSHFRTSAKLCFLAVLVGKCHHTTSAPWPMANARARYTVHCLRRRQKRHLHRDQPQNRHWPRLLTRCCPSTVMANVSNRAVRSAGAAGG